MIARNDLSAKDNIIAASEAKKARGPTKASMGDTAKLGAGFDHQHPRENWSARNMSIDPEFVIANNALAKCRCPIFRDPNHPVNHPHIPALWQISIDFRLVAEGVGTVDLIEWKKEGGCHYLFVGLEGVTAR